MPEVRNCLTCKWEPMPFERFEEIDNRAAATSGQTREDIHALLTEVAHLRVRSGKLHSIANAADTALHHFADAYFNKRDALKMLEAMEQLRQALLASGFGIGGEA